MKFEDVNERVAGTKFMSSEQGRQIYDFVIEHEIRHVLELGFAHGKSSCYFAAALDEVGGDAHLLTMDLPAAQRRSPNITEMLERCGLSDRVTPVYSETSYTWEIKKLLDESPEPRFDFAYIDGGHTWDETGFGFFLVDKLLRPGGWMLFDDLDWTLGGSERMRSKPWVQKLPADQRDSPQVRDVFELLVATHPGYTDVHEDGPWGWARKSTS